MASANFRLGYANDNSSGTSWTWAAYDTPITVTSSQYVKVEPESTTGIESFSVTIVTADEVTLAAGTPTVTSATATKSAVFQVSTNASLGRCYVVRYQINNGVDQNGKTTASYTKRLAVNVLCQNGLKLLAVDEKDDSDRTYGYTPKLNDVVRASLPAANVTPFYATSTCAAGGQNNAVTIAVAASSAVLVYARAVGVSTAGEAGQYVATYSAKRASTATAAAVGAGTTSLVNTEDDAAWGLSFSLSSNNVLVRVTGDSAAVTHWTVDGSYSVITY